MDDIQYFKSAWGDIKNSPGWFGKLCLLALLNLIPVFGQIVTFAYLYGWAREIAWGVHKPLPKKIFNNDDGKFWRRGWFVVVLVFVFALVPYILISLGDYWQGLGWVNTFFGGRAMDNPLLIGFGTVLNLVGWIGLVLCSVLAWIGAMRVSIYDRLSAGFQIGKLWKMLRHDTGGILRIFGMELLFSFLLGLLLSIVVTVLFSIVVAVGVAGLVNAGYSVDALRYMTSAQAIRMLVQFFASAGAVGVFAVLATAFMSLLVGLFVDMLVIRAVGYWTMQFDVPQWDGQDDPMPFELDDKPEDAWINEPPQQPYQRYQPQQTAQSQPGAQPSVYQQPQAASQQAVAPVVAPVAVPLAAPAADAVGTGASVDEMAGDAADANADGNAGSDVGAGALPGFTYAGIDRSEFPAAPEPMADPIGQGESGGAETVEYDQPVVVGAEFLMSPETIQELTPDDVEDSNSGEQR